MNRYMKESLDQYTAVVQAPIGRHLPDAIVMSVPVARTIAAALNAGPLAVRRMVVPMGVWRKLYDHSGPLAPLRRQTAPASGSPGAI